jgi:Transcriptional regulator, AbiEi antitoxin/Protein of unknown function (DUF559)
MAGSKRSNPWPALAEVAARQHGVLSHSQLRRAGLSRSGIGRAAAEGRLHRVFRGAYALGHPGIGERGRLFAATLACGEGTVISHRSTAALMGLLDRGPTVVDLIAPAWRGRKIDGIRRHDVRRPQRWETGTFDGIPCTSPARTLVDLAGIVGARTLRSAFERAAARKLLDIEAIEASIGSGGRRGTRTLRGLLGEWRPVAPVIATTRLKSPLEAKVLPLLAKRDLPMPRSNAPVELVEGRIEVDFLWPEKRFVLEADSRAFHATDVAAERDRWRDRELMRVGYASLRITHLQAETEAEAIAEVVAAHLR